MMLQAVSKDGQYSGNLVLLLRLETPSVGSLDIIEAGLQAAASGGSPAAKLLHDSDTESENLDDSANDDDEPRTLSHGAKHSRPSSVELHDKLGSR